MSLDPNLLLPILVKSEIYPYLEPKEHGMHLKKSKPQGRLIKPSEVSKKKTQLVPIDVLPSSWLSPCYTKVTRKQLKGGVLYVGP